MHQTSSAAAEHATNHPLARRMGVIAWTAHNVIIGSIFGTTGVLLRPMMARLNVAEAQASAGAPMVMIGSAVLASVVGVLAARYSLKLLLALSGLLLIAAWLLLAGTHSYPIYLLAYAMLLGPTMAIGGSVLPPTLVTRWFSRNLGMAIGLVHLELVITLMPLAAGWAIVHLGITATFLALAAFAALTLLPAAALLVDHPPGAPEPTAAQLLHPASKDAGLSVWQLLGRGRFWAFAFAAGAINTSSVVLGVHVVSMAEARGFSITSAAGIASLMSLGGMVGTLVFGWLTDRIGGARTFAVICLDAGLLWTLLLFKMPYPVMALVVGLIGVHGSGSIPAMAKGMRDNFGQASFSRAFGLASTAVLPLMVGAVIGMGSVHQHTGVYTLGILAMVTYFALAIPVALAAGRQGQTGASAPA